MADSLQDQFKSLTGANASNVTPAPVGRPTGVAGPKVSPMRKLSKPSAAVQRRLALRRKGLAAKKEQQQSPTELRALNG